MGIFGFGKKKTPAPLANQPAPGIGPTNTPDPEPEPQSQSQPTNQQQPERDWGYQANQNSQSNNNYNDQDQQASPTNVGHDGAFNGLSREQWRDAWMSSGNKTQQGTDAWLSNMGASKLAGNGTFMTPYGEVLDLGQNYRTGNVTPAWTQVGNGQSYQMGESPMMASNYQMSNPNNNMMGSNGGGMFGGMDPGLMSAFQQFLMSQNGGQAQGTESPIAPTTKPRRTPTYARTKKNPYSATQARQ